MKMQGALPMGAPFVLRGHDAAPVIFRRPDRWLSPPWR